MNSQTASVPEPATLTQEAARHRSKNLRVDSYDLHLDLSAAATQATFGVHVVVEFSTADPHVFLDYLGASVDSVTLNGQPSPFAFADGWLTLDDVPVGQTVRLEVHGQSRYSRTGQGLHRMVDTADDAVYIYSHLEPSDARRIFPCFDQPDLKAAFSVHITAPATWQVLSNQPEVSRTDCGEDCVTVSFAPTPPLSTYLTAFAAGPYRVVEDTWAPESDSAQPIQLRAFARASMADYLDAEILELTQQGLGFFHAHYDFPYPWGKYDSIFVPEYNLGAMENPGLVTFTEKYLFRSQATRAQHAGRANTILHEMSHMWFGDLVTPRWWDDLWLKESFAEFMGADSSVEASAYTEAWANFAGSRKNWACQQDQLRTTHPIKAEIPDVDAARQNFDGITYAKGAAVLKQLVHYVGREAFYAGARDYFAAHAFAAATFDDFLDALTGHTDRDLPEWARHWLRTTGIDSLRPKVTGTTTIEHLSVLSEDPESTRPHRLDVTLLDERLRKQATFDVDIAAGAGATEIPAAAGLDLPALVVVNDSDHAYAKVGFNDRSLETIRTRLSEIDSDLTRAVIWTGVWNMTRDGAWPVSQYVETVTRHAAAETNATLLATALNNAHYAINCFVPEAEQDPARTDFADRLWDLVHRAAPGSDEQLILTRSTIAALAAAPGDDPIARLKELLDGQLAGLRLDPDVRWSLVKALRARDAFSAEDLAAEQANDSTLTGAAAALGARYSTPDAATKREVFDLVTTPEKFSNAQVDSLLAAFNAPRSKALREPFAQAYFDKLSHLWEAHPIEIANRLVRGLYPYLPDSDAATTAFIESHQPPRALARVLTECQDELRRRQAVKASPAQH
ncbi:aminopeptidase N [Corynebacterium confusum]